jgi:hypothetical protein
LASIARKISVTATQTRSLNPNESEDSAMPAKKATAKIPTDAEIDCANLDEINKITSMIALDVLSETITIKEANAISMKVGKRLTAIEEEIRSGNLAAADPLKK